MSVFWRRLGASSAVAAAAMLVALVAITLLEPAVARAHRVRVGAIVSRMADELEIGGPVVPIPGFNDEVWVVGDAARPVLVAGTATVDGYQSRISIVAAVNYSNEILAWELLVSGESASAQRQLSRDPDALTGATITQDAVAAARAAIRREAPLWWEAVR